MVICPSFTVSTPLPSQVSLAWNILLSVLKSAVYTPSASAGSATSPLLLSSVFCCPQPASSDAVISSASRQERNFFIFMCPPCSEKGSEAIVYRPGAKSVLVTR